MARPEIASTVESIFAQAPTFTSVSACFLKAMVTETRSDAGLIYYFDKVRNNFTPRTLCGVRAEEISPITQTLKNKYRIFESILKEPTFPVPLVLKAGVGNVKELAGGYYKCMLISSLVAHDSILGVNRSFKKKIRVYPKSLKGHQIGDEVLKEFGALLASQLREGDKAYRYGGEEFMIILPETELGEALKIAERLREKVVAHTFCYTSGGMTITASFGVNSYPERPGIFPALSEEKLNYEIDRLIRGADEALYQAKS